MKKIISLIIVLVTISTGIGRANSVECIPNWNGTWVVEQNCTFAGKYKVYGDVIVGDKIVTIPNDSQMGMDLNTNKITFTTGKILLQGDSKIDNSISTRHYLAIPYTTNASKKTTCPSGTKVMNMSHSAIHGTSPTTVPSSGTLYCAKV